jgi:hypothetical protein
LVFTKCSVFHKGRWWSEKRKCVSHIKLADTMRGLDSTARRGRTWLLIGRPLLIWCGGISGL